MKCLVTGGEGFIGSHVVDALVTRGHDVLCIEVVDPVELALPDVGMLVLHDTVSGREIEVPTGNDRFRERYASAAADQRSSSWSPSWERSRP